MNLPISDIAFTPSVKAAQSRRGSRESYLRMEQRGDWQQKVTPELADFIGQRDSFYMATANSEGQPYIQHRGGERGFLKVIDEQTLACADFVGNAQYISLGNLDENNKAFIFLMDYPNRRRIKLWVTATVVEDNVELLRSVSASTYPGKPERVIVFSLHAWDVNCPQHIQPRWTTDEHDSELVKFKSRVIELEGEIKALRQAALKRKNAQQAQSDADSGGVT